MQSRRRGRILSASMLLVLAATAFGADRPFLYDRNMIFDEGEVRCAAVGTGPATPDQAPKAHDQWDDMCFPEQLKPWK